MNREQKAAVIEEIAVQIQESEAVFAVDYRGISVAQAAEILWWRWSGYAAAAGAASSTMSRVRDGSTLTPGPCVEASVTVRR